MSDIVERLRNWIDRTQEDWWDDMKEAADEIERLKGRIDELRTEIKRLTAGNERLDKERIARLERLIARMFDDLTRDWLLSPQYDELHAIKRELREQAREK